MEGFRHGPEDIEEMDESKVEKFDASEVNDFMDEYIIPTIEHIYDGSYRMARDLAGKERLNAIYSIMMQYDPFFKGHEQYAGTPINIGKTALIEHIRNGINMFEGNITDYDYIVLEKAIDNTTDETGPEWKITDPDCGQRGRQIGETMYEFEEVLKDGSTTRLQIDLTDYSTQEMESICRDYGTELIFVRKEYEDPWFQVAEWAFENELAENGDVR